MTSNEPTVLFGRLLFMDFDLACIVKLLTFVVVGHPATTSETEAPQS